LSVSRHTGYNLIGSAIPLITAIVTIPIYLRLVGSDRYGVLAIAWLLLGYFGLFDLGLGRATSFRIASLKDAPAAARARTFWAAMLVNVAMGLVGGLVLWLAAQQFFGQFFKVSEALRPEILKALPLLAASVPVATLTGVLTGAVQGRERFLEINIVSVISSLFFQLFPLAIAWKFGPNLSWLLAAALIARLIGAIALAYRCHLDLTKGQPIATDRKEIGILLRYGGWVNVSAAFGPVLFMTDRFMIGALLGATAVTNYTVPVQLASRAAILPTALTGALFPRFSASDPASQRALFDRSMLMFAAVIGLPFVGAIYLIGPFIQAWVGRDLGIEAPTIGRIMVAAAWANGLALISFTRLEASGRPDLVAKVLLIEIPPYLLLLYLGTHFMGVVGSALATGLRYLMDFFLLTFAAGFPKQGRIVLVANGLLLLLAAYIAGLWSITDPRWWISAIVLGSATLAIGIRTCPEEIRIQAIRTARSFFRR